MLDIIVQELLEWLWKLVDYPLKEDLSMVVIMVIIY
jgi:hypothetical protein